MRKLVLNKERLLNVFQKLVDSCNDCYSSYGEDEECYNQVVTITNVSNLLTIYRDFDDLTDVLTIEGYDAVADCFDKLLKGILEVVDTDLEEGE